MGRLFTDIEGSTRLLRELRDRYAELMADYQRLLRQAFEEHEGREIDTQGDSFRSGSADCIGGDQPASSAVTSFVRPLSA